jgi:hypothetical protein
MVQENTDAEGTYQSGDAHIERLNALRRSPTSQVLVSTEDTVEQSQELIPHGIGISDGEAPVGRRVGSNARQRVISLRNCKVSKDDRGGSGSRHGGRNANCGEKMAKTRRLLYPQGPAIDGIDNVM